MLRKKGATTCNSRRWTDMLRKNRDFNVWLSIFSSFQGMNGYKIVLLKAILCFIGCRKVNGYAPEYVCYNNIKPICLNAPIFLSQKGTIYSTQQLNRILKQIKIKYKLNIKNFSCHTLRKTFGRQVYNQNPENAEKALVMLMDMFNHSSLAITKRYIGLRQEEVAQTYESLSFQLINLFP